MLWLVAGVVAVMLGLAIVALPKLLPDTPALPGHADSLDSGSAKPKLSTGALLLGLLCFLGMLTEGANYDWTAIYYRDILQVQGGAVAWGYGAFAGAMALGRWFGDRFRTRVGDLWAVRGGAFLAACGLGLALLWPHPVTSTLGFALSGLGLSNVVPVMYSVAGHALAGRGIATVATIGYAGFLLGPPAIGLLSDTLGLRPALAAAAVGALLVSLLATPVFRLVQLRSATAKLKE